MARNTRGTLTLALIALLGAVTLTPARAAAQSAHLDWAEELVDNLAPENNTYSTGTYAVTWEGVNGAVVYSNHSLCSNFLTALFRHTYGWTTSDMLYWTGSTSPNAALYHDLIEDEDGFEIVPTIQEIQAGDMLAIRYEAGNSASGHTALIESEPTPRVATSPIVPGTVQYEVWVIDSTRNGHGFTDSRYVNGNWIQGAGRGVMRLYANAQGTIVGHTWTTSTGSSYYSTSTRDILVGRLL